MPAQILVSNKSSIETGEIVVIRGHSHKWSANECLQSWLNSGRAFEDWKRHFSLVVVSDREPEQLAHLIAPSAETVNGEPLQRAYFVTPDADSDYFLELYSTGQITADFETIGQFLQWRPL